MTERDELTRITVNLTSKAKLAADALMSLTGDNLTDTINRSIQVYCYLVGELTDGKKVYTQNNDGTFQQIVIL